MGKLIINSDDFGYSRGVNYGIIDAYELGVLTSATIMTNMSGFYHAVKLKKQHFGLGVGVHLTLTCGRPIRKDVKSLTTEDGSFKKINYYNNKDFKIDIHELYAEWDAQINKLLNAGIQPSHLDSHHHVHTFGEIQEVVINLAKKYNLPVRGNFIRSNEVSHVSCFEQYFDDMGEPDQDKWQQKIPRDIYINNLLDKIRKEESTEIMCHTAYIDKILNQGTSFLYPRVFQTDFLIHSEFAEIAKKDKEIELCTYHDI